MKNDQEEALTAFIKQCDVGLQLPFSLLSCIDSSDINKPCFKIDFKITEVASKGVGNALNILGDKIKRVIINNVGLSDKGIF